MKRLLFFIPVYLLAIEVSIRGKDKNTEIYNIPIESRIEIKKLVCFSIEKYNSADKKEKISVRDSITCYIGSTKLRRIFWGRRTIADSDGYSYVNLKFKKSRFQRIFN